MQLSLHVSWTLCEKFLFMNSINIQHYSKISTEKITYSTLHWNKNLLIRNQSHNQYILLKVPQQIKSEIFGANYPVKKIFYRNLSGNYRYLHEM